MTDPQKYLSGEYLFEGIELQYDTKETTLDQEVSEYIRSQGVDPKDTKKVRVRKVSENSRDGSDLYKVVCDITIVVRDNTVENPDYGVELEEWHAKSRKHEKLEEHDDLYGFVGYFLSDFCCGEGEDTPLFEYVFNETQLRYHVQMVGDPEFQYPLDQIISDGDFVSFKNENGADEKIEHFIRNVLKVTGYDIIHDHAEGTESKSLPALARLKIENFIHKLEGQRVYKQFLEETETPDTDWWFDWFHNDDNGTEPIPNQ